MKLKDISSFIRVHLLSICLVTFNPFVTQFSSAEAKSTVYSAEAMAGLERMRDLQGSLRGVGARGSIAKLGDKVSKAGTDFIKSLKGKDKEILFNKKLGGPSFLKDQAHLVKIQSVKAKLNLCIKENKELKDDKRELKRQIIDTIFTSEYTGGCNINGKSRPDEVSVDATISDFIKGINNTVSSLTPKRNNQKDLSDFQDELYMQSLKNSTASYLSIRYKYEPSFIKNKNGAIALIHLNKTLNKLCKDCDRKSKNELRSFIKKKSVEISENQRKSDYSSAARRLRESFSSLNKELVKVKLKVDHNGIDEVDLTDDASKVAMQLYQAKYIKELQKQDGLLMMTSIMKDKAGGLKSIAADSKNTGGYIYGKKYKMVDHRPYGFNNKDLKLAKKEIENKIISQTERLNKMNQAKLAHKKARAKKRRGTRSLSAAAKGKRDIQKLVKTNPAAVGQVLLRNPSFVRHVCEAMKAIKAQDKSDEDWDSVWAVGGLIVGGTMLVVGGVLTLTGVGAPLGAATIAGGVKVTTAATASVFVVGAAEAAYWSKRARNQQVEHRDLESAIFSGTKSSKEVAELKQAYEDFKDARLNLYLSLPLVLLPGIGKLAALSKGTKLTAKISNLSGKAKISFLENMSAFYTKLGKTPRLQKMFDLLIKSGKVPAAKMQNFIELLASGKAKMNKKFLSWLSNSLNKIGDKNPKAHSAFMTKFKSIVDEGLGAAKKACKI